MSRRVDVATGLVAAGALLLLVSLFLEWYDPDVTAWRAFEALDLLLAALALGAVAIAAGALDRALPPAHSRLPALAGAGLVIVAVQLIDPPPAVRDGDLRTGAWLALVGAALMAVGAALTVARVSISFDVRDRPPPPPPPPPPAGPTSPTEPLDAPHGRPPR